MGQSNITLVLLGSVFLIAGLAFKVSAVPFHMWAPDAYEGAMTPVTSFMAVGVKAAAFAVTVRLLFVVFGDALSMSLVSGWPPVIAALAIISMIVGNFAGLVQTNVKRMLAYSSIAHAGYVLVGVTAYFEVKEVAASAVLFYLLTYAVSNLLAFGSLMWIGSKGKEAVSYQDLAGVGRRHPWVAVALCLSRAFADGPTTHCRLFRKVLYLCGGRTSRRRHDLPSGDRRISQRGRRLLLSEDNRLPLHERTGRRTSLGIADAQLVHAGHSGHRGVFRDESRPDARPLPQLRTRSRAIAFGLTRSRL